MGPADSVPLARGAWWQEEPLGTGHQERPGRVKGLGVDAPLLSRRCLVAVLDGRPTLRVVADAATGQEVLARLPALRRQRLCVGSLLRELGRGNRVRLAAYSTRHPPDEG